MRQECSVVTTTTQSLSESTIFLVELWHSYKLLPICCGCWWVKTDVPDHTSFSELEKSHLETVWFAESALYCELIADPYIHINGSNSVRLSAGSALYCELIDDPYIHINGSNSVRLSAGSALYCGLIADPYIHINGSNSVRLSAGSALYCGLVDDPYIHMNGFRGMSRHDFFLSLLMAEE